MTDKLMVESLSTAREFNLKLIHELEKFVDSLERDSVNEALIVLPDIIEGLEWIIQVINFTKDVQKETIDVIELNQNLSEMSDALENEDYVLLADITNYEIIEKLKQWQQINFSH